MKKIKGKKMIYFGLILSLLSTVGIVHLIENKNQAIKEVISFEANKVIRFRNIGDTITVSCTVSPENAINKAVKWSVSDEEKIQIVSSTETSVTLKRLKTFQGYVALTVTSLENPNVTASCRIRCYNGFKFFISFKDIYHSQQNVFGSRDAGVKGDSSYHITGVFDTDYSNVGIGDDTSFVEDGEVDLLMSHLTSVFEPLGVISFYNPMSETSIEGWEILEDGILVTDFLLATKSQEEIDAFFGDAEYKDFNLLSDNLRVFRYYTVTEVSLDQSEIVI